MQAKIQEGQGSSIFKERQYFRTCKFKPCSTKAFHLCVHGPWKHKKERGNQGRIQNAWVSRHSTRDGEKTSTKNTNILRTSYSSFALGQSSLGHVIRMRTTFLGVVFVGFGCALVTHGIHTTIDISKNFGRLRVHKTGRDSGHCKQ